MLRLGAGAGAQDLTALAAIPENSHALAAALKGQPIRKSHVILTRAVYKIEGLADRRIGATHVTQKRLRIGSLGRDDLRDRWVDIHVRVVPIPSRQ